MRNSETNRFTSSRITELEPYQVFVFGSNEKGVHGAGAAKQAVKFGAKYGEGIGQYGQTYAIPTKDSNIQTLPLERIKAYVNIFTAHAKRNQDWEYLVTEIGCGLAGYQPEDIAPLFKDALKLYNVILPKSFYQILKERNG